MPYLSDVRSQECYFSERDSLCSPTKPPGGTLSALPALAATWSKETTGWLQVRQSKASQALVGKKEM